MERLIDYFSSRAPEIQLSDLLRSVKSGYDNQTAEYEQNLDAWEKKRKHPQTFENEISKIQCRLDEYRSSMNGFVEKKVKQVFTGKDSSYGETLKQIKDKHLNQLRGATSLDTVKRGLENFYNAMSSLGDDVVEEIRTRFEEEVKRLGGEFKAKHDITVPTIDTSAIKIKAEKEAYDRYNVPRSPRGAWEWTQKIVTLGLKKFTEEKAEYSDSKYLSNLQSNATKTIENTSENFPKLVSSLVDNYGKSFQSDLNTLIASRKRTLEEIKKSKAENDEILENIKGARQKKKDIAAQVSRINNILGDIR